jgi:xylulokinase
LIFPVIFKERVMGAYLLGFDCGTYESKGVISTIDGRFVAAASSKNTLRMPRPGFAEHDPIEDWWKGFNRVLKELFAKSGVNPQDIRAIGISAVMAAITPVDENCRPLRNAILYGIDTRSVKQAEDLNRVIGEEKLRKLCGDICGMESFGPKIKWIADNEPDIFNKAKHFTIASGFLTARLMGEYGVDIYSAQSALPMFEFGRNEWNDEMCGYVCPREKLPKIMGATDVIGQVSAAAAAETGLAAGTPVITGTTDAAAEAVSVGVVEPEDMMLMYGSTIFMNRLTGTHTPGTGLWPGLFVLDKVYCLTAGMATTGSLTRWIRDNMAKDLIEHEKNGKLNAYDALFREAEGIAPGSDGLIVLPYFLGERMPIQDPRAKGVFFGLTLSHTRGHLVKAALEGIAYGVDQILEGLRKSNIPLRSMTAVGGGAKTPLWIQIVSDVTGVVQTVPELTVGAAYGDALLAGIGIGALTVKNIKDLIKPGYVTEPDLEKHHRYGPYKTYYRELYLRTRDIMYQLRQ